MMKRPQTKIVAYSKNATFRDGLGYLLWETPPKITPHDGCACSKEEHKPHHFKTPMPDFLRLMLK